jgi:glycosyltransferase involved in cell wall biosynthesis
VLFFSETESRRLWRIPKEKIRFNYRLLKGFLIGRSYQGGPIFFNPGILPELIKGQYEIIIVGGYHHPTIWIAFIYACIARKRFLLWSETTSIDKRSYKKVKEWLKRLLVRYASGYIVPGKAQKRYLMDLGARDDLIFIAPNSVDSRLFSQPRYYRQQKKEKLKRELGIKNHVCLYVGRMIDQKGIPDLIDAYETIHEHFKALNLLLVGDGPQKEEYIADCTKRGLRGVIFTGFQEQEDLPKYYAIADIFILPSLSEPWGLVLNEAMLAGLPLICSTAVGASRDLVQDGENGILYEPGDICRLAVSIEQLIKNDELRRRMGAKSAEIINKYTPEIMAEGFKKAIKGCNSEIRDQ